PILPLSREAKTKDDCAGVTSVLLRPACEHACALFVLVGGRNPEINSGVLETTGCTAHCAALVSGHLTATTVHLPDPYLKRRMCTLQPGRYQSSPFSSVGCELS